MNFMTRTFSILMIFILNILKLMNFRKSKPDIFEILWPMVVLQLRENPASPPFSSACPPPPTVVQGFTVTCTHTSVSPVSSNCYFTLPPPPTHTPSPASNPYPLSNKHLCRFCTNILSHWPYTRLYFSKINFLFQLWILFSQWPIKYKPDACSMLTVDFINILITFLEPEHHSVE